MKKVLTIAGSDSSGGAGIQADIKTATALGVYSMSVITALTAQNTMSVDGILNTPEEFMKLQLKSVLEDITPDAVKIGMLGADYMYGVILEAIEKYNLKNVVIDPVMVASSGGVLSGADMIDKAEMLYRKAALITPNVSEAEQLAAHITGRADKITGEKDMEKFAEMIFVKYHVPVLLKGGHSVMPDADDLLFDENGCTWFHGKRIEARNNHGTGCTLSTATACNLACEMTLKEAIREAKSYVKRALEKAPDIGHGCGPLNHCV